jgi:hypothetical protein
MSRPRVFVPVAREPARPDPPRRAVPSFDEAAVRGAAEFMRGRKGGDR